ncbi:MAG: peptidoglycan D,D-transpeptidase FtsI family protein [Christensenellaceae bacterium]|jgi:peptidoglycan glycosyltransferase
MKNVLKFRRNMRFTMWFFILLFIVLIVYFGYSVIMYGEKWYATPYNPRLQNAIDSMAGGAIYDRNGVKLAWNEDGTRQYNSSEETRRSVSHVVGDVHGKSMGAETVFAKYIYGIDKNIIDRFQDILDGTDNEGSDITLTIDADLSKYIYQNMEGKRGAVVVINYKTGEILASVSILTFDPRTVATEELKDTQLLNRATMGRYPPGSIMKVVTASAALETGIDITYTCTGRDIIGGQPVTCTHEHGTQNLEQAFTNSCNTYFAQLSVKIGGKRMLQQANKFGFNTLFNFSDVELYRSKYENSSELGDVAWAGIGQYTDLITPLHAAMIAGAVGNDGVMMQPKLLKEVSGSSSFRFNTTEYKRVLAGGIANTMQAYMREVVLEGTGTSAGVEGMNVSGKTGTAEYYEDGEKKNHSWFIGFSDKEHPYAVAVIFEGAGFGSAHAAPMTKKVFTYLRDHGY